MTRPADRLHTLLTIVADRMPGGPVDVRMPDLAVGALRGRRHRGLRLAAAFVAVALAVGVPVLLGRHASSPTTVPGRGLPLTRGQWARLPAAPIAPRMAAASVWTGSQMLVWGGKAATANWYGYADGTAYNPSSGQWTMLPAAPLTARSDPAYVWTGTAMFVWGGLVVDVDAGTATWPSDGALYDPSTGRWRAVAKGPLAGRAQAWAVWTGSEVVVIGGWQIIPNGPTRILADAAAYDPARNSWRRLPDLPVPASRTIDRLTAVATPEGVYAWAYWHTDATTSAGGTAASGISQMRYDQASGRWRVADTAVPRDLGEPLWTGSEIVFPAAQPFYGDTPGPHVSDTRGWAFDPAARTWQRLPHGPVDDVEAASLWVGNALLSYNSRQLTTGPDGTMYPGAAALWDPTTDQWTRLPDAPLAGLDPAAVWTGNQFIEWGPMVPNRTTGNGTPTEGGLSFGP